MRRISARWIPHLLTKEQKLARVRIAKQLLKQFPKYNSRSFANIITGDEMWVHFYEPKRKIQNKIWATKGSQRPCIAKRTMSIKKVMYVIFFTNQGPAIQIAIPKGKSVNAKLYKGKVLHKLNCWPATGLCGVRLLHENVSSHKAAIVCEYLKQEKVVELPHPPYLTDLAPCDFFLFPRLKNTSLEENIKRAKISVRLFFSVWTVYLEKIMKTHLKFGLKDWNFVYHMVASILKDWDKDFGIVC